MDRRTALKLNIFAVGEVLKDPEIDTGFIHNIIGYCKSNDIPLLTCEEYLKKCKIVPIGNKKKIKSPPSNLYDLGLKKIDNISFSLSIPSIEDLV